MNSNINPLSCTHAASETGRCRTVRRLCFAAAIGLAFAAVNTTYAQVSAINSVVVTTNLLATTNLPSAVLTVVTNYPSLISFTETNAGDPTSPSSDFFPIQELWQFSTNGTSAYLFQTNDYFTVTVNVTLTGNPVAPRKEAGFAFNDADGIINGQYILDTDAGEVVAFGGNLPFYASPLDHDFKSGETITMSITMCKDSDGSNAIIYSANGISSGVLEFNPQSGSPPEPYTLGGYFQLQGQDSAVTTTGSAVFQNISIGTPLSIAASGANSAVVYWPASATNYVLQTATNLTSTNWTTVNGQPVIGVIVPNTTPQSYYRLHAQ